MNRAEENPELRAMANQVASLYFSTQAARMDASDILYEALELVYRERTAALKESSARVEFLEKALGELYTLVDGERLLVRDGSVWVSYGDAGFQPAPSLAGYIDALKEQGGKP